MWFVAPEGSIRYANRRWREYCGPEGGAFGDFVHPDDLPDLLAGQEAGEPFEIECRLRRASGGYGRFRVRIAPSAAESGTPAGWICTAKRSEGLESGYHSLAEAMAEAIVVVDEAGTVRYANPAAGKTFGHTPEELVGGKLTRIVPERLRRAQEEGFERYLRTGERRLDWSSMEFRGLHRCGEEIPLEVSFSEFERDGRRYFAGIMRDLTERRRAEEERDRFFKLSLDLLCVASPEGYFTKVNPAFEELLGYTQEELLSRPFMEFVYPEDREATEREVERLSQGLPTTHFENRYVRADGEHVWLSWRAMRDAERRVVYAAARDVTGERRAKRELVTRAAQQAAVAELGRRALEVSDLGELLDEAARLVARTLGVRFAAVMRLLPDEGRLLLLAGAGWSDEVVGKLYLEAGNGSHAGYTLKSGGPVVIEDLRSERRFKVPETLRKEGVVSGVSEVIRGANGEHFGVLSAHSTERREFTRNDVDFVCSIANVLAAAIERVREEEELQAYADRLREQAEILDRAHVLVRDLDDRIVFWNSGAEELYGFTREEALGRTSHELLKTVHSKPYAEIKAEILDRGRWSGELVHTTRSGRRVTIASHCVLHRNERGRPAVVLEVNNDITKLRETEKELKRSEARFRTLVQNLEDVISVVDEEGRFLYASPSVHNVLGYGAEEIEGRCGFDLVHPDDLEWASAFFSSVLSGEAKRPEVEVRMRHADGGWRDIEANVADLREDAAVGGVLVTFRDVTERREAERAVHESHARLTSIIEGTREAIFLKDRAGRYVLVNSRTAEVIGRPEGEILGRTDAELFPPEVAEPLNEADAQVLLTGKPLSVEETLPVGDEIRTFLVTKSAYRDGRGEVGGVIGVATDISNLKRAREALRQSKDLYRAVVENATENIFIVDVETRRILQANPAFRSSLGYTPEEIERLTLYDIVAHDRRSIDRNFERILELGNYAIGERLYLRKDGTFMDVEVGAAAISYGGRSALCVVAHDITERRRAEEAAEEVREAERNRIARDLHDLVLQHIVGTLQTMQAARLEGAPEAAPELSWQILALREAVRGLRGAIYDLRTDAGQLFARSVRALVEQERELSPERELTLLISDDFPEGLPERISTQLIRALREALANVRKHSGADRASVDLDVVGGAACVEVSDNGRGFSEKSRDGGFGISGMRERLALVGGECSVRSEPGAGTRVVFCVPLGGEDRPVP